jgi:hypothetical protein
MIKIRYSNRHYQVVNDGGIELAYGECGAGISDHAESIFKILTNLGVDVKLKYLDDEGI